MAKARLKFLRSTSGSPARAAPCAFSSATSGAASGSTPLAVSRMAPRTAVRPIASVTSTSAIDRHALELASQHRAHGALGDDRAHGVVAPGQRLQDRVGPLGHPGEDALRAELVVDRLVAGEPED